MHINVHGNNPQTPFLGVPSRPRSPSLTPDIKRYLRDTFTTEALRPIDLINHPEMADQTTSTYTLENRFPQSAVTKEVNRIVAERESSWANTSWTQAWEQFQTNEMANPYSGAPSPRDGYLHSRDSSTESSLYNHSNRSGSTSTTQSSAASSPFTVPGNSIDHTYPNKKKTRRQFSTAYLQYKNLLKQEPEEGHTVKKFNQSRKENGLSEIPFPERPRAHSLASNATNRMRTRIATSRANPELKNQIAEWKALPENKTLIAASHAKYNDTPQGKKRTTRGNAKSGRGWSTLKGTKIKGSKSKLGSPGPGWDSDTYENG